MMMNKLFSLDYYLIILYFYHFFLYSKQQALDLKPNDKNCLIARGQCYMRLGDAEKSLADANETLKEDPKYIKVGEDIANIMEIKFVSESGYSSASRFIEPSGWYKLI